MTIKDNSNRISFDMPSNDDAAIESFVKGLETTLASYCVDIGDDDPRTYARMTDDNFVWVNLVLESAEARPDLCPGFMDRTEFARDVTGAAYFTSLEHRLEAVLALVRSSNLLCRFESYQAALAFYASAKHAAKIGIAGAQAIVDRLSPYFESRGKRTIPSTAAAGATAA